MCIEDSREKNLVVNDVINIGNDKEYTILELAQLIIQLTGSRSAIEFLPSLKEGDMSRRQPDASKMKSIIGNDLILLEDGIKRILNSKIFF